MTEKRENRYGGILYKLEGGDGFTRMTPHLEDLPAPEDINAETDVEVSVPSDRE